MPFFTQFVPSSVVRMPQERHFDFLVESLESREMLTGADAGAGDVDTDMGDDVPVIADDDVIYED